MKPEEQLKLLTRWKQLSDMERSIVAIGPALIEFTEPDGVIEMTLKVPLVHSDDDSDLDEMKDEFSGIIGRMWSTIMVDDPEGETIRIDNKKFRLSHSQTLRVLSVMLMDIRSEKIAIESQTGAAVD